MRRYSVAALLMLAGLSAVSAQAETEFQITCSGRATMTVSRAAYGLSTLMWGEHHFQIASGQTRSRINDGDKVAITQFRNGDQLIVNKSSGETFFAFNDSDNLTPCNRSADRDTQSVTLERWDAAAHVDS